MNEYIAENKDHFNSMVDYLKLHMQDCKSIHKAHYWIDMIGCGLISWTLFIIAILIKNIWIDVGILFICSIFFYRGVSFSHELVHHSHQIKGFRVIWDIFFGIPYFFPSYFYHSHLEHHREDTYGTVSDPEYVLMENKISYFIYSFWAAFIIPIKLVGRSLIFPLTLCSNKFAHYFEINMSHAYINPEYQGHKLQSNIKKGLLKEDISCSIFLYLVIILMVAHVLPFYLIGYWYFIAASVSLMNNVRFFVSTHRYRDFFAKTREEQIADSFTYLSDSLFAIIIAPVGLRYHALHHLFPNIPYHSLKKAHLILTNKFPDNLIYQSTFIRTALERLKRFN